MFFINLPKPRTMRKCFLFLIIFFVATFLASPSYSYFVKYKEQYYKLYHVHLKQGSTDVLENIYYLEKAIKADFCNPLYALATIKDERDWEKYRYLFLMHLNLKMVEQHLVLASRYDKKEAFFYNYPWKEQNIDSLNKAEEIYKTSLIYWQEAKLWAEKANVPSFQFLYLDKVQYWEDEKEAMITGSLNYEKTVLRQLARLKRVKEKFLNMQEGTY